MMGIKEYKKEFFFLILGASLSAVVGLSVGLYNLNTALELTLKKDHLYGLKTDITLLKNVESELDENVNLLINNDYKMKFQTEEIELNLFPELDEVDSEDDKEAGEMFKRLNEYMKKVRGRLFKVTEIECPSEEFIVNAWEVSGPTLSSIDFELIQKLNEHYRKLNRLNKFINGAMDISKGMHLLEPQVNTAKKSVPKYNAMVDEVSQKSIIELKNDVIKELDRLQRERNKIEM